MTQHTLLAQKIVVEQVCKKVGYPPEMSKLLINSFDNIDMFVDGKKVGRAAGTLMSGHRLTTFINTVLNLAYLRVFCPSIRETKSMHVGDDVVCVSASLESIARVAIELMRSPIKAKAEKQSMGNLSSEFLRMCTRGQTTRGYVART